MRPRAPWIVRFHGYLQRKILRSLGNDHALQAAAAFQDLYDDPQYSTIRSRVRLVGRELSSLFVTAMSEYRESRKQPSKSGVPTRPLDSSAPNDGHRRSPLMVAIENILHDIRFAIRNLSRTPGFVVKIKMPPFHCTRLCRFPALNS